MVSGMSIRVHAIPGSWYIAQHRQQTDGEIFHCGILCRGRIRCQIYIVEEFVIPLVYRIIGGNIVQEFIGDSWSW